MLDRTPGMFTRPNPRNVHTGRHSGGCGQIYSGFAEMRSGRGHADCRHPNEVTASGSSGNLPTVLDDPSVHLVPRRGKMRHRVAERLAVRVNFSGMHVMLEGVGVFFGLVHCCLREGWRLGSRSPAQLRPGSGIRSCRACRSVRSQWPADEFLHLSAVGRIHMNRGRSPCVHWPSEMP